MAQAGVTARRGDPVKGEIRVPKLRQCSGTPRNSFFGKLTGSVRQADQYAWAACDSMARISRISFADGNSNARRPMVSADVHGEQFSSEPQIDDAPIHLGKAFRNM